MTIIELAKILDFKEVAKALRYHYPYPRIGKNTMKQYGKIMDQISKYKVDKNKDKDEQLVIDMVPSKKFYDKSRKKWIYFVEPGEEYYSTSMKKKGSDFPRWAIEFTLWEISSNWQIAKDVLKAYKPCEIMAHYLWEVTYVGYTQAPIKKKLGYLEKAADEIKKGTAKLKKFN